MTTLGPICSFLNGGTPSRGVSRYYQGDVPWITGADISGARADTARSFITEEAIRESATNRVPAGTVLLVTRTSVGKVAVAAMELCFSQDITAITPDPHCLDTSHLVHFLRTKQPHLERLARGATIKGVTREAVANLAISLPPLAEQKRIAGILDAADALRAKRREALAQLDTLLQSTFLDMFGDPVTNPMGWGVVAFESIGNSRLGKMLDKGKEVGDCQFRYLANTNVQWGRFDLAALRTMDFSESDCEEFKLEHGDLLICEGGEVGRTAIWHGAHDRIYFQKALHRVRLDPTVAVPEYVFQFMWFMAKNGGFRDLTTSATIAHLTGVKLKRLPCPRPPLELQHRFAAIVESVEQQKASQRTHLAELDTLFASLQSRAFRGEL